MNRTENIRSRGRNRMKNGFARGMGLVLLSGFVWAIPGAMIELLANLGMPPSFASSVDMWPQTLAMPGLVAGLVFCALLAASGRWRGFETSSLALLLGLGGIVGLAMAGIVATGWVGGEESWGTYVFVLVMSPISAVASALAFRFLARRQALARAEAQS